MQLKQTMILSLILVLPLPVSAGNLYPMEGGNCRRENRSLSPSSLKNPIKNQWTTSSCLDLKEPYSNPVILSDTVIQSFFGGLRCYDRNSGQRLWTWKCDPQTTVWGTPCYDQDRGRLYVNCFNGDTLALDAQTGSVAWKRTHQSTPTPYQYSSPMYVNGKLYIGNVGFGFLCIDPDTQQTLWELNFTAYFGTYTIDGVCTPAYDNGSIYLSSQSGRLFSLNAQTGSVNWYVKQNLNHITAPLVSDEYVYVLGHLSQVECRSRGNGSLVWAASTTSNISGHTNGNLALCGETLIVPGDSWKVWGLNRHTGARCWATRVGGNFALNTPIVVCGKVYISACHGDFYSLDGATGQIEWNLHHGIEYTFVGWAEADGQLYVANKTGAMMCFVSEIPGDPADCRCDLPGQPPIGYTPSPAPTSIPIPPPVCFGPDDPTATPTSSATPTPSGTWSPVETHTNTATPTVTPTGTITPAAPAMTQTPTTTETETTTPTNTATVSETTTPTVTPTATRTPERICDPRPDPNPCDGRRIHYRCAGGPYNEIHSRVYTAGFRKVCKKAHSCTGAPVEDLDLELKDDKGSDLANGLYFLEVETHANGLVSKYTRKVLICR